LTKAHESALPWNAVSSNNSRFSSYAKTRICQAIALQLCDYHIKEGTTVTAVLI